MSPTSSEFLTAVATHWGIETPFLMISFLTSISMPYADGTDLVWVQEEPFNSGAWYFINAHIPALIEHRLPLRYVTRPSSASPATGSKEAHKIEQKRLVDQAFGE